MPLAVVETIALEIESRLSAMIGSSDYSTSVVEVYRPRRFAQFTPRNNQVVLVQGQTERVPMLDRPGNPPAIAIRQTFEIHCHVMQDERDESTIDSLLNAFHADIVKRSLVVLPHGTLLTATQSMRNGERSTTFRPMEVLMEFRSLC